MTLYPKGMTWKQAHARASVRRAKRAAKRGQIGKTLLTKTALKKKLWDLVSLYVRLRDKALYGDRCRVGRACRGRGLIECAFHLVPSNDGAATRYDPANIVGACNRCNRGEQLNRFKYEGVLERVFGKAYMDDLRARARAIRKYSTADLIQLAEQFKSKIEKRDWGAQT